MYLLYETEIKPIAHRQEGIDRTVMINTKTVYLMIAAVLGVSLGTVSNSVLPISAAAASADSDSRNSTSTEGVGGRSDSDKLEVKEKEDNRVGGGGGGTALQDETIPAATSEQPAATSELPKCDGSFQDCVTANGDICKAGQGGHECECAEDMSDCPNHPSLTEEPAANTTEGFVDGGPDGDCLFNPSLPKCASDNGECPDGFFQNEDGSCFPQHDRCPKGYHSHENDETGRCIPNSTPCEPGYIIDPGFPTCSQKESVCNNHPELKLCGGKGGGAGDDGNSNGNDNDDKDVIIKNINNHKVIIQTIKHDRNTFPDIDIIGLSVKGDNGDAMVCLMNIGKEQVQCQDFDVPNERVGADFLKVVELDPGKEYDNGNTGSSYIDGVINNINNQNFNELKGRDNHDFDADLAAVGINSNGDGMVCIIEESSAPGKALCEPFKVTEVGAVTGQITEITKFI